MPHRDWDTLEASMEADNGPPSMAQIGNRAQNP